MSKTTIKADLLLASLNDATGDILYTWLLTYPRPILAEVNTHRVASKNTSSSRAIPGRKMRERVRKDCFIPVSIGSKQKGMQAGAEIEGWRRKLIELIIVAGSKVAVLQSALIERLGAHKQVSNRYLEPYSWVRQVFSATDVNNLIMLRDHPDAEPHFRELARQMHRQVRIARFNLRQMREEGPRRMKRYQVLSPGQWHLPFVMRSEFVLPLKVQQEASIARCGRTSYKLLDEDKISTPEEDHTMCGKLFGASPMHLSPTEHPAMALGKSDKVGNFRGFLQYRKTLANEDGERMNVMTGVA